MKDYTEEEILEARRKVVWIKDYILNSKYFVWIKDLLGLVDYQLYMYSKNNNMYVENINSFSAISLSPKIDSAYDFRQHGFLKRVYLLMRINRLSKHVKFKYKKMVSLEIKMDMPIS